MYWYTATIHSFIFNSYVCVVGTVSKKRKGKIQPYKVNSQALFKVKKRFYIKRFPIHSNACTVLLCYQQSLSNEFFLYFYLIASKKHFHICMCNVQTQKFGSPLGKRENIVFIFSNIKAWMEKKYSRNEKYQWKIHFVLKLVNYYSRSKWMFCYTTTTMRWQRYDYIIDVKVFFNDTLVYTWIEMIFMLLCASSSRLHINYFLTTSNRNWISKLV